MKLTKYIHSCVLITKDHKNLLIDPGVFTTDFPSDLPKIDVLIITHEHPDHLDEEKVTGIVAANPNVLIYGPAEVASKITTPSVTVPETDQPYEAAGFELKFYGGQHAVIHPNIPVIGNFGVSVDGKIFYPGDSYTPGPESVAVLLTPAGAPWMKMSEAMDFVTAQKAQRVVPTHDAVLSDIGKGLADRLIGGAAEQAGGTYQRLQSGESIET